MVSVTAIAEDRLPVLSVTTEALTPLPARLWRGKSLTGVRLPIPLSEMVKISRKVFFLLSSGFSSLAGKTSILMTPSPGVNFIPVTPEVALPMGRTLLSGKRIANPLLVTKRMSLSPLVS